MRCAMWKNKITQMTAFNIQLNLIICECYESCDYWTMDMKKKNRSKTSGKLQLIAKYYFVIYPTTEPTKYFLSVNLFFREAFARVEKVRLVLYFSWRKSVWIRSYYILGNMFKFSTWMETTLPEQAWTWGRGTGKTWMATDKMDYTCIQIGNNQPIVACVTFSSSQTQLYTEWLTFCGFVMNSRHGIVARWCGRRFVCPLGECAFMSNVYSYIVVYAGCFLQ